MLIQRNVKPVCVTDQVVNYKDLMSLMQLTHRAGPAVRLIVCKRVSQHLFTVFIIYSEKQQRQETTLRFTNQSVSSSCAHIGFPVRFLFW